MKRNTYCPEGGLLRTEGNRRYTATVEGLRCAMEEGIILEGRGFLCDEARDLHVSLGAFRGIMPKEECLYPGGGEIKDIAIISRVGKTHERICYLIPGGKAGVL